MQQVQKKKKKKLALYMGIGIVVFSALLGIGIYAVAAPEDEETSLTPASVHIKSSDIENSTLVIGSHLIYIGAMTDELYQIAYNSAATFSQTNMYYKSELGGGSWYEISSATSIADISTQGTPVTNSVVEELSFTHHTKSDGITYDLTTGQAVNIFDINDPYDLRNMEELRPLTTQYQMLENGQSATTTASSNGDDESSTEDKDATEELRLMIKEFFDEDLKTTQTAGVGGAKVRTPDETALQWERQLNAVNTYYQQVSATLNEGDEREMLNTVMSKLDAERRVYLYTKIYALLDELTNNIDAVKNSAVAEAIVESQGNLQTSINEYSAKGFSSSTSVIGQEEYRLMQELVAGAEASDSGTCTTVLKKLGYLYNIKNNTVDKGKEELDYLNSDLLPKGEKAYKDALAAGMSQENLTAAGSNPALLERYAEETKSSINAVRTEYQFLIQAKTLRISNEAGQAYMTTLIQGVDEFRNAVKQDAAKDKATETVEQYLVWLKQQLSDLVNSSRGGTDMSVLQKEKDALLQEKQKALDNNQLGEANRIDALIQAKDNDIAALEQEYSDTILSATASEADKSWAAANLSSGTAGATALAIGQETVSDIQSGNLDDVGKALDSLEALMDANSSAVTGALQDIESAWKLAGSATDSNENKELTARMNSLIKTGEEKSSQDGLSANEAEAYLQELMGSPFMNLTEEKQQQAVLALEWYGEIKNSHAIKNLAAGYSDVMLQNGSRYAYSKLTGTTEEYASTKAISEALGYRYVFDDSRMVVTLQKGKDFYEFTAGKSSIRSNTSASATMAKKAEYQTYLYIPGTFVTKNFDCQIEYVDNSSVAILYTPAQKEQADEIYQALLTKGGD